MEPGSNQSFRLHKPETNTGGKKTQNLSASFKLDIHLKNKQTKISDFLTKKNL